MFRITLEVKNVFMKKKIKKKIKKNECNEGQNPTRTTQHLGNMVVLYFSLKPPQNRKTQEILLTTK